MERRWNHNLHYHPLILGALPSACDRVLDVGCGEGTLARALSERVARVTAIDADAASLERARREAAAPNIDYVLGDFLRHGFEPASFDAIVCVAALHHMGTAAALARMRTLLRPGGTIAVLGLARSRHSADLGFDVAGVIATRLLARGRTRWESAAPRIWPPPESYRETRRVALRILPGARYRRHVLFRYSLVWTDAATISPRADASLG